MAYLKRPIRSLKGKYKAPAPKRKKRWKVLSVRLRKEDLTDRLPDIAVLIVKAIKHLWDDGTVLEFKDEHYRNFVAVELLHGDQWRRCQHIVDDSTAIEEVNRVHQKYYAVYLKRKELQQQSDGIDRRMIHPKEDKRLVREKGANYTFYGTDNSKDTQDNAKH